MSLTRPEIDQLRGKLQKDFGRAVSFGYVLANYPKIDDQWALCVDGAPADKHDAIRKAADEILGRKLDQSDVRFDHVMTFEPPARRGRL